KFNFHYDSAPYSELDQYLMGIRTPGEVDESQLFIVNTGDPTFGNASIPIAHGKNVQETGTKMYFTMDDVIAANGPRDPEREPCHWKTAFVLIYPEGQTVQQLKPLVDKLEVYRKRWEEYYDWATSHRGSMDTTLSGHGPGTPTCPAPGYPDGGYPEDDAGFDSGVPPKDGGVKDAGTKDGGAKDGGAKDGGKKDGGGLDSGVKPDGATHPDSGEDDDTGISDDGGEPENDGGHHGDGGTPVDPLGGCSCSAVGV
ncbi:MAG: hypothetical protein WC889_10780, partial [Myxococcota bacterium]